MTRGYAALVALASAAAAGADAPAPAVASKVVHKAAGIIDEALSDKRPAVRAEALAALGASSRADARAKLVAALEEDDGHTRFGAAQGLTLLKDPESGAAIVAAWRREKGWLVKKQLSLAAGATGARDLVPDLKAALLYEQQAEIREALAWALLDLGEEEDARVALGTLGNPERKSLVKDGTDSWSRHVLEGKKQGDHRLACKTLAVMGRRDDAPLLEKELDSPDLQTRLWAAAALVKLSR